MTILLAIRFGLKPPKELFRKLLHLVAFASSAVFVLTAENYVAASAASLVFAVGVLCLVLTCELAWYRTFAAALITAIAGSFTELLSHGGNDTVTVPAVNILILALLILL